MGRVTLIPRSVAANHPRKEHETACSRNVFTDSSKLGFIVANRRPRFNNTDPFSGNEARSTPSRGNSRPRVHATLVWLSCTSPAMDSHEDGQHLENFFIRCCSEPTAIRYMDPLKVVEIPRDAQGLAESCRSPCERHHGAHGVLTSEFRGHTPRSRDMAKFDLGIYI